MELYLFPLTSLSCGHPSTRALARLRMKGWERDSLERRGIAYFAHGYSGPHPERSRRTRARRAFLLTPATASPSRWVGLKAVRRGTVVPGITKRQKPTHILPWCQISTMTMVRPVRPPPRRWVRQHLTVSDITSSIVFPPSTTNSRTAQVLPDT